MSKTERTKKLSLTSHITTIDVAQRLLRTAGPKKCGDIRESEFEALIRQLDDLRDIVRWLERHQAEFREWWAERRSGEHE
ncbi:hypothetical protein WOB59_00510 [Methylocystis sp. IM4]|uniref:hypothetical protein n=1 Tax=Methylocystis sp. IM4 TaxID=3136560 RepID=UPI00311A35DB